MIEKIKKAKHRIDGHINRTQLLLGEKLSNKFGGKIYLKLENTQISGSFKIRGGINKMLSMPKDKLKNGVIAASAGNHAQAVALAASNLGIPSTIVMPENAPLIKISATEEYGGNVILKGKTFDEAFSEAEKIKKEKNLEFIHPFDDEEIIAGQGTIGLEIIEDLKELDQIIVPVGGGGLIAGIATAIKNYNPKIKIIGVQTYKTHPMLLSLKNKKYTTQVAGASIADGIAVGKPGKKTFEIVKKYVDEIVTVSEGDIYQATLFLLEKCKIVAEGAGVTSVAAIMNGSIKTKGKNTVSVISGGNIDVTLLESIINNALILEKRRAEIKVNVINKPGEIYKIFDIAKKCGVNIHDVKTGYSRKKISANEQAVTIVVDVKDEKHLDELIMEFEKDESLTIKK